MLLAVKIGNSNIGLALLEGTELTASWRIETRADKTADEYASQILELLGNHEQSQRDLKVAIVSVVPGLTATFVELSQRYFYAEPFVVTSGIKTGLRLHYQDPRALGADRLVAVVAARARYGAPALVVDFGTATTFNALDAAGDFAGGAIAPGLEMESQALHEFTAKLPRVEVAPPPRVLATNTRDALMSGIFYGYVGLVEGMIGRLKIEMGALEVRVIATGGLATILAPFCPSIHTVDLQLAFEGLRLLYELNRDIEERTFNR